MSVIRCGRVRQDDISKVIIYVGEDYLDCYPYDAYDRSYTPIRIKHNGKVRFEFNAKAEGVINTSNCAVGTLNSLWKCVVYGNCANIEANQVLVGGKVGDTNQITYTDTEMKIGHGRNNPFQSGINDNKKAVVVHLDGYVHVVDIINGLHTSRDALRDLSIEVVIYGDVDGIVRCKNDSVCVTGDVGYITANKLYKSRG